jgi:hypothetical protein
MRNHEGRGTPPSADRKHVHHLRRVRGFLALAFGHLVAVAGQKRLDGGRQSCRQGNLDEDEGLTRQGWVEEAEAAPVGCKAAVRVFPALDLVDGLMGHQLLQHPRPASASRCAGSRKTAIEPGSEEMTQVGVERLQGRLTAQVREEILAHRFERRSAALRHVHSAQQFLTGRFGRLGELTGAFGRWLREVGLRGRPELGLRRQEVLDEEAIKRESICGPPLVQ